MDIYNIQLLKVFELRDAAIKYHQYLPRDILSEEELKLLDGIKVFFQEHEDVEQLPYDEYYTWFHMCRANHLSVDQAAIYKNLLQRMKEEDACNPEHIIDAFMKKELKAFIDEEYEKDFDLERLREMVEQTIERIASKEDEGYVDVSVDAVFKRYFSEEEKGYRWQLNCLNNVIGEVRPGMFGVIGASTNAGKSSFLCSLAATIIPQLAPKDCILWVGAEQDPRDHVERIFCSYFDRPLIQLVNNIDKVKAALDKKLPQFIKQFQYRHLAGLSVGKFEALVKKLRPKVIFLDSIDHFSPPRGHRDDIESRKLYQQVRQIAIRYRAGIITTAQAIGEYLDKDNDKHYYKFIPDTNLEGSRRAKQQNTDFIIMIGYDPGFPMTRYINIPRVKKPATEDYHRQFQVKFDPLTGRYSDDL